MISCHLWDTAFKVDTVSVILHKGTCPHYGAVSFHGNNNVNICYGSIRNILSSALWRCFLSKANKLPQITLYQHGDLYDDTDPKQARRD